MKSVRDAGDTKSLTLVKSQYILYYEKMKSTEVQN